MKVARGYVDSVRPFVAAHAAGGEAGLRDLGAGDVTAFLTAESRRLAPKTVSGWRRRCGRCCGSGICRA